MKLTISQPFSLFLSYHKGSKDFQVSSSTIDACELSENVNWHILRHAPSWRGTWERWNLLFRRAGASFSWERRWRSSCSEHSPASPRIPAARRTSETSRAPLQCVALPGIIDNLKMFPSYSITNLDKQCLQSTEWAGSECPSWKCSSVSGRTWDGRRGRALEVCFWNFLYDGWIKIVVVRVVRPNSSIHLDLHRTTALFI